MSKTHLARDVVREGQECQECLIVTSYWDFTNGIHFCNNLTGPFSATSNKYTFIYNMSYSGQNRFEHCNHISVLSLCAQRLHVNT